MVPLQTVVVKQECLKMLKPRKKLRSFRNVVFQVIKFGYPLFFLGFNPMVCLHFEEYKFSVWGRHINHLYFCNPQIYSKTCPYEWHCSGVVYRLSLKLHLWYVSIQRIQLVSIGIRQRGLTGDEINGWYWGLMTLWGLCLGRVKHDRNVKQSIPRGLRSRQLSTCKGCYVISCMAAQNCSKQ